MAQPSVVLYDDACPICSSHARLFQRLDWRAALKFVQLSNSDAAALFSGISNAELHAAMHVLTPNGKVLKGMPALRHIASKLPLLWPLCVLLWIPGVNYLGHFAYNWFARRRYAISRRLGMTPACDEHSCRKGPDEQRP